MGQRELLVVVIASLVVGSCVADYESNGRNLSWIYDIKNSATTQNQTYRLNTDTGAFRYHFDISAVDSYKFETNSNDSVTMGCYGWKDLTNKWHSTNYVADSHGRRNVRDINKPVEVYPSENEHAMRLFLDYLPQCLAFALDTPPLMVYVFTNHPPTKPPPVVFEPHDHVPHSSEVIHKIHEGHVPPYTGGGSPTIPLAKAGVTGGGSVKVPVSKTRVTGTSVTGTSVTGGRSVKVPLAGTSVTGGSSVQVPLAGTGVTGGSLVQVPLAGTGETGGSSVQVPLAGTGVTGGSSVHVPLAGTGVTGGSSEQEPLAGAGVTGGSSVQVPLAGTGVTGGSSVQVPLAGTGVTGESLVQVPLAGTGVTGGSSVQVPLAGTGVTGGSSVQVPLAGTGVTRGSSVQVPLAGTGVTGGSSVQVPLAGTGVTGGSSVQLPLAGTSVIRGSGTLISIQSNDGSSPRPSLTFTPSVAVTGGDSSKESLHGTGLVPSLTVAKETPSVLLEGGINAGSDIEIGTRLVSPFTVGLNQGTPTVDSLPERKSGFEIGPPLVPVLSFGVNLGSQTGATLLDKPSNPPVSISTTTTTPNDSEDLMNIFNPSKWGKALKSMVNSVLTVGQKIFGIPNETATETSVAEPSLIKGSTLRPDLSPTPSKQAGLSPVTSLYKVDIPTLSKTGLTSDGSKLVDLPKIGSLSQDDFKTATPSGSPTDEVPSGFKISVKEANPGPDSIISIDVSPPAPAFLANFASSKGTLSPVEGIHQQNVLIASTGPATDSGNPSASSLEPTGRPFADTTQTTSLSPKTAPAIPNIPSAGLPIDTSLFGLPQNIDHANVVISQKLPSLPGFKLTSPQFVQTVPTGFPHRGPTISTNVGEFISSQHTSGLLPPVTTPSSFANRYDFSTNLNKRPAEYGPSSLGPSTSSGLERTVTAEYLPPPTAEGPLCSCVCPMG